jgi:glutamyl-tRNA synthetase
VVAVSLVLLKSDGFPTYHLAVVVDDHLMNITHVVRGEEWLPSAPKHILLYQYFDWSIPKLIHTPTLRSEQGKKLSKREGNTDVWWYREQGFLPQALLNFLGLLVWKPNEQTEQFSKEDMAELFEWREMQVTGPVFDINKLRWLNGKYLRQLSLPEFLEQLETWMQWVTNRGQEQAGPDANPQVQAAVKQLKQWQVQDQKQFTAAIELAKDRARTLSELKDLIAFYFTDQLSYDREDLLQGHSAPEMMPLLKTINQRLQELEAYTSENWEQVIRSTADELGFSHKDAFMSLRSAVTARKHTPPLFAVMQVLGPEASHQRVVQAIAFLQNKA